MIRKNIYKWHRTCSLIIAIPVLLWAMSGFMHPVMTSLRPAVALQSLPVEPIDSSQIKLTLEQALKQNKVDSIYSARLVHIDTNWFYQVSVSRNYNLWYISAKNGNVLAKGDWLYAQYLARLFLEGIPKKTKSKMPGMEMPMAVGGGMDCCGEAASAVLNNIPAHRSNCFLLDYTAAIFLVLLNGWLCPAFSPFKIKDQTDNHHHDLQRRPDHRTDIPCRFPAEIHIMVLMEKCKAEALI